MHQLNAIIYSPAGKPFDLGQARDALAHARRRGYDHISFQGDWNTIDEALRGGRVHVVLFADDVEMIGADPGASTQRLGGKPRKPLRVRRLIGCGSSPSTAAPGTVRRDSEDDGGYAEGFADGWFGTRRKSSRHTRDT